MRTRAVGALLLAAVWSGPAVAWGESVGEALSPPVKRLTFGDDEIRAGRATGAGEIIGGQVRARMKRLRLVRADFIPELIRSAERVPF